MSEHLEFHDEQSEARSAVPEPAGAPWHEWLEWALPRLLWVPYFAVLGAWIGASQGGLGSTFLDVFGWHALLMSLAVFVFLQEAVLFLAAPLTGPRPPKGGVLLQLSGVLTSKWTHTILILLALLFWVGGHIGIVMYKELAPQPAGFPFYSMFSPHAWLGAASLVVGAGQALLAAAVFLVWPALRGTALGELHRFLGKVVYVALAVVCALGFQDMQSSDLCGSVAPYVDTSNFTSEQIDGMGYYPDSTKARLSCALVILVFCQVTAVFWRISRRA